MLDRTIHPLMSDLLARKREKFPEHWGEAIRLSQDRIDLFASATGDRQYIHIDPDKAAKTKLGGTVAHGFGIVSLIAHHAMKEFEDLREKYPSAVAMHCGGEYTILAPVREGTFVRCRGYISFVEPKRRVARVKYSYEIASCEERRFATGTMVLMCSVEL